MTQLEIMNSCHKLWKLWELLANLEVISWDYLDPNGGITTVSQDEHFTMKHGPISS